MEELHTVVVVGASAGGLDPLCHLIGGLPSDFPAAVLVTMHIGPGSQLAEVLRRCGEIEVIAPQGNEPLRPGCVYVAPSDRHMAIAAGRIALPRSARENRHRPSIDVLFRSAARHYRRQVIGVILSGTLDDGAAGMYSIKARGGVTIVQDPKEALMPDMPTYAINYGVVDHSLPVAEIAPLLVKLAKDYQKRKAPVDSNASSPMSEPESVEQLLHASHQLPFVCPECNGPLYELRTGDHVHVQCVVGHSFSPASLTQAQSEALERALWVAVRSLADRKRVYEYAAARAAQTNQLETKARLEEGIQTAEHDLKIIQEIIERI